jgi:antitoxin component YwqK of YwqJK toxin-antitoxin module
MKSLRLAIVIAVCCLVSGCWLELSSDEGGFITTQSGNYECLSGALCEIEVSDTNFDEVFIAVPTPGYFFYSWAGRADAFCPRSSEDCALSTAYFGGNEALMGVLDSDQTYVLEPVFMLGECGDLSEEWTETIEGKEVQFSSSVTGCPDRYTRSLEPHGVARMWQDGTLISESHWLTGQRQGRETQWWPNGNLKAKYRWDYDAKEGAQRQYRKDGSLRVSENYRDGMLHGESHNYNAHEELNGLQTFFENILHGRELIFYSSGALKIERFYKLGKLQGMERRYQEDGVLLKETNYVNDRPLGPFAVYDINGTLVKSGNRPVFVKENNQVIRDKNLGIRWTRDANLYMTLCDEEHELVKDFVPADADNAADICLENGAMTWNDAKLWVQHLGDNNYGGHDAWRLPIVSPEATLDVLKLDGEMSQLYYMSLDNPSGEYTDCNRYSSWPCLQNSGPFINIQEDVYWSGSLHPVWEDAFFFVFSNGHRSSDNFENLFYVWPVSPLPE